MADRLGRVAGGRWPVKPKAAGRRREVPRRVGTHRGIENGGWDGMLQEEAGWLRQGSGPQVMVGVRNLMIDECFFSGKTSLAAGNRHGHVPPRESGGTRVNLNRRMKRALGRWSQDLSVASSAG